MAGFRKMRYVGLEKIHIYFTMVAEVFCLVFGGAHWRLRRPYAPNRVLELLEDKTCAPGCFAAASKVLT